MAPFTFFPHCLSLFILLFDFSSSLLLFLVLEKNLASKPWQDGYLETLVCHSLGQPAFWIKSYSLPEHLISDSLTCQEVSMLSLDLVTEWHCIQKAHHVPCGKDAPTPEWIQRAFKVGTRCDQEKSKYFQGETAGPRLPHRREMDVLVGLLALKARWSWQRSQLFSCTPWPTLFIVVQFTWYSKCYWIFTTVQSHVRIEDCECREGCLQGDGEMEALNIDCFKKFQFKGEHEGRMLA